MKQLFVKFIVCIVLINLAIIGAYSQEKPPLTNDDIVKMVKKGVSNDIIIKLIETSKTQFDVSTEAVIQLKNAGVSNDVIKAMVETTKKIQPTDKPNDPNDVTIIDGNKKIKMEKCAIEQKSRFNPWSLFTYYPSNRFFIETNGRQAKLQIKNSLPVFELYVPAYQFPSFYVMLVKFVVRSNHREVECYSFTQGISDRDKVPVKFSEISSPNSEYKLYRIDVMKPLSSGEYAIIVNNNNYYDFGITEPEEPKKGNSR